MVESRNRLLSWRLTTAEITYHLPDYPDLLQNFIWQELDLIPEFPVLRRFLEFWSRSLAPLGQGSRRGTDETTRVPIRRRIVHPALKEAGGWE
jgi:uncharacterized protein Usg